MRTLFKDKTGGVVTNTVMGIGGLIIGVIVILVITTTLIESDVLTNNDGAVLTTVNESTVSAVTETGIMLANNATLYRNGACTAVTVTNSSSGYLIGSANYTVTDCRIAYSHAVANAIVNNTVWNVTYTTTYTIPTDAREGVDSLQGNFTTGIDNISEKVPTILLIIAVVFLFGALVLLVRQAGAMGIGTGSL